MLIKLPPGKKRCPKCKSVKDLDDFAKRSDTVDGHEGYCITCRREIATAYAKKRKDDRKAFREMF